MALAWSVVAFYIIYGNNKFKIWQKCFLVILLNLITFPSDWSCIGLMIILSMYEHRGNLNKQMTNIIFWTSIYSLVSFLFVNKIYGIIQMFVVITYPLLSLYNGQKGENNWLKWFFYLYYPLHLIVLGIIRMLMYGNVHYCLAE